MAFLPVPTYADPVVVDEKTGKSSFSPVWLDWFLKLSTGGLAGTVDHNATTNLQGGSPGSYYHLTAAEHAAIYLVNNGAVFGIAPGGSPFLYQNTATFNLDIIVTGGAGVTLTFSRANITFYALPATGMFMLSPGDYLNIVYVGVPTVTGVPR